MLGRLMKTLPGFRDFYPEEQARRRVLFDRWAAVARAHGFAEIDAPTVEPLELYRKKSGDELVGQLFSFTDRGEREIALRPELTPTVARMVAARHRELRRPVRWFSLGSFFRLERPQRGRTREFCQFNCDMFGVSGPGADAEMIALLIALLRAAGLGAEDFAVRVSDRAIWNDFGARAGLDEAGVAALLQAVDKLGREPAERTDARLREAGVNPAEARAFLEEPAEEEPAFAPLRAEIAQRGLGDFVVFDRSVVRGLAYYTGVVFEAFDRKGELRAIAGGGRYDGLLAKVSDGAADLPAAGFAIGDVVIMELIAGNARAAASLEAEAGRLLAGDVYLVIADETARARALELATSLRAAGVRTDFPLRPEKVGRQFQTAEQSGCRLAVVFGAEWPEVRIKVLATREEIVTSAEALRGRLEELLGARAGGR